MPSSEVFKDVLGRLSGCDRFDYLERYGEAARLASFADQAPAGSPELGRELYDFIIEALITIDTDESLTDEERSVVTGRLIATYAGDKRYDATQVWQAVTDCSDQMAEESGADPTGIRTLGAVAGAEVRKDESFACTMDD